MSKEVLKDAIADLDEDVALEEVDKMIADGVSGTEILEICQDAMAEVGDRYTREEYYVSDLMMSGEIFTEICSKLNEAFPADESGEKNGRVVIGTVKGDIHDIGKDIVVNMLRAANFDVIDLGVDVAPEKFVATIKESGANILGMSGLLTIAFDSMKETVEQLTAAGLRDKVKIMVGGGPVDENVCRIVGADDWSTDAQKPVQFAKQWSA